MLSCTDSDSEFGPTDPHSPVDTPVTEAEASSVVSSQEGKVSVSASQQDAPKAFIPASDSFINSLVSDRDRPVVQPATVTEALQEEGEELLPPAPVLPTPQAADVPWMNVDLEGAEAARNAQVSGRLLSDTPAAITYDLGTLEGSQRVGEEDGPVWAWISGGGCDVDVGSQISWLSPSGEEKELKHLQLLLFLPLEICVSPPGPLPSSLSLTPVQSAAWSEQPQQTEPRQEISKKPLERSNVRVLCRWLMRESEPLSHVPFWFCFPVGVGSERLPAMVERLEAAALAGRGRRPGAIHQT